MNRTLAPVLAVVAAFVVWAGPFTWFSPWADPGITDIPVYQRIADAMASGQVPYRDFDVEYPPLATAIFWLADHMPFAYENAFRALMALCLCITAAGVAATAQAIGLSRARQAAAIALVACAPLLLGNVLATRFDLALAATLAWMLFAAVTERWRLMWSLMTVGILLKLVPLLLIPLLVVWQAHRAGRASALRGAAASAGMAAAVVAPFFIANPSGTWNIVGYHLDRPPQIESMASTYMLVLHALAGVPVQVGSSFGSQGLPAHGPAVIAAFGTAAMVALVGAIAFATASGLRRARRGADARLLVAGAAATIAALLATGKVLSPQFMVWLLPATFLVAGRFGWGAASAGAGALVVTQLYFPDRYFDLVALNEAPIWILAVRNAVLIVLVALCWPRAAIAAPPPAAPLVSRGPGAPAVHGPDRALKARYLMD